MKVTKREKYLLIILAILSTIVVYYNFVYIPQRQKINTLKAIKKEYEDKKYKIVGMDKIIKKTQRNLKILNYKIQDNTTLFFPSIEQEKIIVELDELIKKSELTAFSIKFSEREFNEVKAFQFEKKKENKNHLEDLAREYKGTEKNNKRNKNNKNLNNPKNDSNEKYKNPVESITATINFKGNYLDVVEFISKVEEFEKRIVMSNIKINKGYDSLVTGVATLEFYAVPKINEDDKEFLKWKIEGEYGKQNPFDGLIGISNEVGTTIEDIHKLNKEDTLDFVMAMRSEQSDLPTVMLGKANDKAKSSYVYADNPVKENVEIYFLKEKDKYYFKYKTENDVYPTDFNGKGEEFIPKSSNINLKIYSNKRIDKNDLSRANIKIYNKTDKQVNVNIQDDDITKPRVNISSEGTSVNVKRN
ncbi:hypothetical protein FDF74_04920 [Clostridium niameyense]|uniref:Type IV pilus assembly protein PilO n=1 Tax=Clostridium niameyense TaxID=1622073 RepID=A0A6M0R9U0_9CLOT|nr:hypothetical protein [Clostridium niameyense]NEZ46557.1 hypothetical protein [Clostridium niameyense]